MLGIDILWVPKITLLKILLVWYEKIAQSTQLPSSYAKSNMLIGIIFLLELSYNFKHGLWGFFTYIYFSFFLAL